MWFSEWVGLGEEKFKESSQKELTSSYKINKYLECKNVQHDGYSYHTLLYVI